MAEEEMCVSVVKLHQSSPNYMKRSISTKILEGKIETRSRKAVSGDKEGKKS